MKNQFKLYVLSILILGMNLLSGCATNASVNNMIIRKQMSRPLVSKILEKNITVDLVSGGHESNPMWMSKIDNQGFKEALAESLKAVNLHGGETSKYKLNAEMLKLKQPIAGFNLTVACVVRYRLLEVTTSKLLYNRVIKTAYTAKFVDDFIEATRLKDANEGAARQNITKLIEGLYKLRVKSAVS